MKASGFAAECKAKKGSSASDNTENDYLLPVSRSPLVCYQVLKSTRSAQSAVLIIARRWSDTRFADRLKNNNSLYISCGRGDTMSQHSVSLNRLTSRHNVSSHLHLITSYHVPSQRLITTSHHCVSSQSLFTSSYPLIALPQPISVCLVGRLTHSKLVGFWRWNWYHFEGMYR